MNNKIFLVESVTLNDSWIVQAKNLKGAIIETLAHLKPQLEHLEAVVETDVDLELKVSEVKEPVTMVSFK